jgi:hypothetical protein
MNIFVIIVIVFVLTILLYFLFKNKSSSTGNEPSPGPGPGPNNIPIGPAPIDHSCFKERVTINTDTEKQLNVQPLVMSGWGLEDDNITGFCGEAAFKSAMLYHGNYVSQFQVYNAAGGQLLLGTNDNVACSVFHLTYTQAPKNLLSIDDALTYIKTNLDNNLPVLLGAMTDEDPPNDISFDHTIPLIGYYLDKTTQQIQYLIYNDLYSLFNLKMDCSPNPDTKIPKCFRTRKECQPSSSPDQFYSPLQQCIPNVVGVFDPPGSKTPSQIFLLTITGNEDPYNELYPIMLILDANNRVEPDSSMVEDDLNYPPVQLGCTITIGCLTPGKKYSLLRFDKPEYLPLGYFMSGNYSTRHDFTAKDVSYTITLNNDSTFLSNGTYFFRCVETDYIPPVKSILPKKIEVNTKVIRPRKNNKKSAKNRSLSKARLSASSRIQTGTLCTPKGVSTNDNICSSTAPFVHTNWVWSFPPNPKNPTQDPSNNPKIPDLGCLNLQLTAFVPGNDSLIDQVCTFFTTAIVDSSGNDISAKILDYDGNPFNGGDNGDTVGSIDPNGMPYFTCLGSWYFSATPISYDQKTLSYTMISENGNTISTLTPV